MSRILKSLPVAATLALTASFAQAAFPIDFGGYFRSGFGTSSEGGKEACFGLAGAGSKFRLGNECETYGELAFGGEAFKGANGFGIRLNTRLAFVVKNNTDFEQYSPAWREANAVAENIGTGAFSKAKAWVGKRFYDRQDVHISDYYFWNDSGPGAGLENIDLGGVKLAYAIIRNADDADNKRTILTHDIRFSGIKTNPDGELTLGAELMQKRNGIGASAPTASGHLLTAMHVQSNLMGGFNKIALQYGKGSGAGTGSVNFGALTDDKVTRITEQIMVQPEGTKWSGMGTFVYEDKETASIHSKWTSFGVRPVYHFADNMSLAAEFGYDQVKPDNQATRHLTKFTIAPQLSAGNGFWSRPVLRAYYTYAKWNDAAQSAAGAGDALSTTGAFGAKTNGSTVGFQVETWW
ncbi:maltoporin [Actimicrobium sp. GrIS 1.19]|uniref:maltoporin n=1 Tax=Actimicrobium sp. GrIS 1.19 TaxID=3071708 RepID=UPI002E027290|nr:maltoporin [Actimicrobium sp. GrIS 1.19]